MIIRISEAHVRDGRGASFLHELRELVSSFPDRFEGLLGHEILRDLEEPDRFVYFSRWRDESALEEYAGAEWLTSPVTFPDEAAFLRSPLALRHLVVDNE